jgi:large subunit ribosomal protein L4
MDVLAKSGDIKGTVELPDSVFKQQGRQSLLWEAVRSYLANQRQGTAKAKSKAEVSGTGKKPYRQKHTGRARHGSRRSPIFVGGGVVFGPHPRDYGLGMPRKKKRQALRIALTQRHEEGAVRVVEDMELERPKTKALVDTLGAYGFEGSVLLVLPAVTESMRLASRNVQWLTLIPATQLHTYAVLKHDNVVFTEKGLVGFLQREGDN